MQDNFVYDTALERRGWIREAGGRCARIFLALLAFELISGAAVYGFSFMLAIFDPDTYLLIADDAVFNILLSSVPMYLIAFPVLYLIIRKMKVHRPVKTKLEPGELLLALFVAEALMLAGNYVGLTLMSFVEGILGQPIPDSTAGIIAEAPPWILAIIVVAIGPTVEELIFRKLFIDRLRVHGDLYAIIVSSVAFGIFHQNIYQLFYATLIGFLLGYLYIKSGDIKKPILIHMAINFFGSVAGFFVQDNIDVLNEILETIEEKGPGAELPYETVFELYGSMSAILSYTMLIYGMAIAGIVIIILAFVKKQIKLSKTPPLPLDAGGLAEATLLNVGAILFLVLSVIMTVSNALLPLL